MHSKVRSIRSEIARVNPLAPLIVSFPSILFPGKSIMPPIVYVMVLNQLISAGGNLATSGAVAVQWVKVCITESLESSNSPASERWCR